MQLRLGAELLPGKRCRFTVWAPLKNKMVLHIVWPEDYSIDMVKDEYGYFTIEAENIAPGTKYFFKPDSEKDLPDPLSLFQADGVHGPSCVIDHSFQWSDSNWNNIPFSNLILYELHVGTFTDEGTFDAIIPLLDELKETGINAIELMPVAQFPGDRNWGYDAVYPYAVQNSYGGPLGLKNLVNACHQKGIAVFLDVVYNHLGPEGNYLAEYGPYFTDKYSTPWGDAINFDGEWSDGVREYFCNNALYWFKYFHIDGLRLDAIHMIFDNSAVSFWELLNQKLEEAKTEEGRSFYLIAESDLNSPNVIKPVAEGGYGFTAQWLDDFHHALYTLLDAEGKKRYEDFGTVDQLVKAYNDGFVLSGDWVKFRKRKYGASSAGVPGNKFLVFNQNHDQVGNRVGGERLCMLVDESRIKIAAAAVLLAPYIPMLFMGEEYADDSPFYYFVSHSEENLIKAVQEGRKNEFKDFGFDASPPDPQDENTFRSSKLKWKKRNSEFHKDILDWHKQLIALRRSSPVFKNYNKEDCVAEIIGEKSFVIKRTSADRQEKLIIAFNLSERGINFVLPDEERYTIGLSSHPLISMETEEAMRFPALSVSVLVATKKNGLS